MNRFRFCLLLMLFVLTAQAQPRVEIFELENRPASAIIAQLRTLYPGQDKVFSQDGQRLMVKAEDRVIDEIGALIDRLDVAPAQMRITLRRQQTSGNSRNGGTTLSTRDSQSQQSIVVQDGETARIESGIIRQVTRAVQGGDTVALINEDTPMTDGFLVQPRALGPAQVELRVVSFNNEPPRHYAQGGDRETAAVVTLRRAMPGEWVMLGSSAEASATDRSGRTYTTGEASASQQRWSIKVDILP